MSRRVRRAFLPIIRIRLVLVWSGLWGCKCFALWVQLRKAMLVGEGGKGLGACMSVLVVCVVDCVCVCSCVWVGCDGKPCVQMRRERVRERVRE
jgi:hypothetical protein